MSASELNNQIKRCRAKNSLTQAALAEKVGVTRKTINTIENGIFVPSTVLALKIATVLNLPFEQVFQLVTNDEVE